VIPYEGWFAIFSFLNTESLLAADLTNRHWHSILKDNLFWRQHFFRNYYYRGTLHCLSWKRVVLNHFYWKKDLQFQPLITYAEKNIQFCEFIDQKRALIKVQGFLKVVKLEENLIEDLFIFPVHSYEVVGDNIIAIFSDKQDCAVWSKNTEEVRKVSYASLPHTYPIFSSNKNLGQKVDSYDYSQGGYVTPKGSLMVGDNEVSVPCIQEGYRPTIYTIYPESDLLLVGCFPGRVQAFQLSSRALICDYQEENGHHKAI
jgi:hypothetical protein